MKQVLCLMLLCSHFIAQAVVYDRSEISRELSSSELQQISQSYLTQYFTHKNPDQVIDKLLQADLIPLQKEYILHQLLTEIAQQPPQDFFQKFVNLMKSYQVQATQAAHEGPLPVPIFNITSKAYGIENIWTAYRTEQRFNQLFNKDIAQTVSAIGDVIAENSRPKWLGVKNSIAALNSAKFESLQIHLLTSIMVNSGYDKLISHVGLTSRNEALINKALKSNQTAVREYTLRKLPQSLPQEVAKDILIASFDTGLDKKFCLSLLHLFSDDEAVKTLLINQLNNKALADSAAFALSQSSDLNLPELLKRQYLKTNNQVEQNHILLALKLNKTDAAKLAIEDLKSNIEMKQEQTQWLKSFDGGVQ